MRHQPHISAAFRGKQESLCLKLYRQDALQDQCGSCHYCYTPLTPRTATADHKLPRSKGGRNTRENIAASCRDCNGAKGDMTEGRFFAVLKKPPTADMPFPIMLAWMRRKVNLQMKRSCRRMDRLFDLAKPAAE